MTERAKQLVDDLRGVAKTHNQTVRADLYYLENTGDYVGNWPESWSPMEVTIDPDGVVKKVPPIVRMRGMTKEQLELEEAERETITDERLSSTEFLLGDEVPTGLS